MAEKSDARTNAERETEAGRAMNAMVDRVMTDVSGGKSPGISGEVKAA